MAFILLVPLLAVSLVMLILSINIDPTSPTMTLRLDGMLPSPSIALANAPPPLAHCADAPCPGGHEFQAWDVEPSSYNMSQALLTVLASLRL